MNRKDVEQKGATEMIHDNMPILRMSLEGVVKDLHLRMIAEHTEIQKWFEANMDSAVAEFVANELPSILKQAVRSAVLTKINIALSSPKFTEEVEKAVGTFTHDNIKDCVRDMMLDETMMQDSIRQVCTSSEKTQALDAFVKMLLRWD